MKFCYASHEGYGKVSGCEGFLRCEKCDEDFKDPWFDPDIDAYLCRSHFEERFRQCEECGIAGEDGTDSVSGWMGSLCCECRSHLYVHCEYCIRGDIDRETAREDGWV
eukprot:UN32992